MSVDTMDTKQASKKVVVENMGCQMNSADSEKNVSDA